MVTRGAAACCGVVVIGRSADGWWRRSLRGCWWGAWGGRRSSRGGGAAAEARCIIMASERKLQSRQQRAIQGVRRAGSSGSGKGGCRPAARHVPVARLHGGAPRWRPPRRRAAAQRRRTPLPPHTVAHDSREAVVLLAGNPHCDECMVQCWPVAVVHNNRYEYIHVRLPAMHCRQP